MLAISLAPCCCPVCDGDRLLGRIVPNCYAPLFVFLFYIMAVPWRVFRKLFTMSSWAFPKAKG
jgi:hypothetical protein|nr:hypothetical protein Q903MT_gene1152 [Picea sitchensis]